METIWKRRLRPWRRGWTVAASALALAVGACGGTAGNTPSSPSALDTAGAKKVVADHIKRPTAISLTVPIGKPVPSGRSVAYISCGTPACVTEGDIVNEAAAILGWTAKVYPTNGSAQQVKDAWATILRTKPDGVLYSGIARSLMNQELLQAQQANIFVAASYVVDPPADGLSFVILNDQQFVPEADTLAAMVVADTTEAKPGVVYVTLPDYPLLTPMSSGFEKAYGARCQGCSVDKLGLPISAIGSNAPDQIVSFLRSHPATKNVVLFVDTIGIGLPAALKAAGLTDVKVFGRGPTAATLAYLAAGSERQTIATSIYETTYGKIDAMARKLAGVPLQPPFQEPIWIMTKDSLPADYQKSFPEVENYKQAFSKLWGKS